MKVLSRQVASQEEFLGSPSSRSASIEDNQKAYSNTTSLAVGLFSIQMPQVQLSLVRLLYTCTYL